MHFGPGTNIDIWASPCRGTLPTVAIVAEQGPIICPDRRAFNVPPPGGGNHYPAIAARLQGWLADLDPARVALVISHGITLRVLRREHAVQRRHTRRQHIAGADFRIKDGVPTALHFQAGVSGRAG